MKNLGDLNNWTKTDLARVINQALFGLDKPMNADHFRIKRMVKSNSKAALVRSCQKAINVMHNPS